VIRAQMSRSESGDLSGLCFWADLELHDDEDDDDNDDDDPEPL
jgi:hypothetical protein